MKKSALLFVCSVAMISSFDLSAAPHQSELQQQLAAIARVSQESFVKAAAECEKCDLDDFLQVLKSSYQGKTYQEWAIGHLDDLNTYVSLKREGLSFTQLETIQKLIIANEKFLEDAKTFQSSSFLSHQGRAAFQTKSKNFKMILGQLMANAFIREKNGRRILPSTVTNSVVPAGTNATVSASRAATRSVSQPSVNTASRSLLEPPYDAKKQEWLRRYEAVRESPY